MTTLTTLLAVSVAAASIAGDTVTITGTGFGTHPLQVEWAGEWIEALPVGTNPNVVPGWNHAYPGDGEPESGQGWRDHITDVAAWSGTQSLDLSVDQTITNSLGEHSTQSSLAWTAPEPFTSIYASWWFYFQPHAHNPYGLSFTQLKHVYVTCDGCNNGKTMSAPTNSVMNVVRYSKATNTPSEFMWENNTLLNCSGWVSPFTDSFNWAQGVVYPIQPENYWRCQINGGASTGGTWAPYAPPIGEWVRLELYAEQGIPDQPSGTLMFATTRAGHGRLIGHYTTGVTLQTDRIDCRNPDGNWQEFIYYLFFDDPHNDAMGLPIERATMYVDDTYIQTGTQARVEIGDAPIYDACGVLAVQPPLSWSDTAITARLNLAGLPADRWLFVIDGSGAASYGMPLTTTTQQPAWVTTYTEGR